MTDDSHAGAGLPLRIAFVGLGGAGQRHARVFRAALGWDIQWTAVRTRGTTPALDAGMRPVGTSVADAYRLEVVDDLSVALDRGPDLVVVATPTALHRRSAVAAIEAGCAVLVEKPLTITFSEAKAVADAAGAHGAFAVVGFQRRFHPAWRETARMVRSGELGTPQAVAFWAESDVATWHPYEKLEDLYAVRKDLGGGVVATECHELDQILGLLGPPAAVRCRDTTCLAPSEVERSVVLELRFPSLDTDARLTLSLEATAPRRGWQVRGTEATVEWDESSASLAVSRPGGSRPAVTTLTGFDNETLAATQNRVLLEQLAAGQTADLGQAVLTSSAIDAAHRSMASGTWEALESMESFR